MANHILPLCHFQAVYPSCAQMLHVVLIDAIDKVRGAGRRQTA